MTFQVNKIDSTEKQIVWNNIRNVINLSLIVKSEAEKVIKYFIDEKIKIKTDSNLKKSYELACEGIEVEWELYWAYARLSSIIQFGGGFGIYNLVAKSYTDKIVDIFNKNTGYTDQFWPDIPDKDDDIDSLNISQLFQRTILLDIILQFYDKNNDKYKEALKGICDKLFKKKKTTDKRMICNISKILIKTITEHNAINSLSNNEHSLLKYTRLYNIIKLVRRLISQNEINIFNEYCTCNNCKLNCINKLGEEFPFQEIERALTRGNNNAPAFRVALLLRLLGGRYINGSFILNPRWTASFLEGVKYVLDRQSNDSDACWHDVGGGKEKKDFWVHPYMPLLCILDLSPHVLLPHLSLLTDSCHRSLNALLTKLRFLSNKGSADIINAFENDKNSFDIVIAAYSLSMAVYDRLRDLLSDSVLDNLGAEVQTAFSVNDVSGDVFPKALNFQLNIENGVIKLWGSDSSERPGAILIFGPPGTGKTTISKILAQRLNYERNKNQLCADASPWRFLEITPADFAREGSDKIVACAEKIFTQLKDVRRCVVLLDEMEEFIQARTPVADKNSRLITTAFLPLLQDVVNRKESILVVATNFVGNIDPAVTRRGRFGLILPLGPPNKQSRKEFIKKYLEKNINGKFEEYYNNSKNNNKDKIQDEITRYTMGYILLEIKSIIDEFINDVNNDLDINNSISDKDFIRLLWKLRVKQVPTALSNRVGCDWHTFANETKRFARYTSEIAFNTDNDVEYWNEPGFPEKIF